MVSGVDVGGDECLRDHGQHDHREGMHVSAILMIISMNVRVLLPLLIMSCQLILLIFSPCMQKSMTQMLVSNCKMIS
jgi:hypothetical protein